MSARKRADPAAAPAQSPSEGDWLERVPAAGPDPEQAFAKRESVGAFMAHLVRLPAPLRSAIMICDVGEHRIEEASAVLGLAPNTVKVRLHRGRAKLGLAMRRGRARRNVYDILMGV